MPTTTIGDNELPLYGLPGVNTWALINLLLAIAGAALAIVAFIQDRRRHLKNKDDKDAQNDNKRSRAWLILAIALAVAGVVAFLVTEDMQNLMVLLDQWTLLMAILFAGVCVSLAVKRRRERQNSSPHTTSATMASSGKA